MVFLDFVCCFFLPLVLILLSMDLDGLAPYELLPAEFPSGFQVPDGEQRDIHAIHVIPFGIGATHGPYKQEAETLGEFQGNLRGKQAEDLLETIFPILADEKLGSPILNRLLNSSVDAIKASVWLRSVYDKAIPIHVPPVPLHLEGLFTWSDEFSRAHTIRIAHCLKNVDNMGYLALMNETAARKEIRSKVSARNKRPRPPARDVVDDSDEEEDEGDGDDGDPVTDRNAALLYSRTYGAMVSDIALSDGTGWLGTEEEDILGELFFEPRQEEPNEDMQELLDSLMDFCQVEIMAEEPPNPETFLGRHLRTVSQ